MDILLLLLPSVNQRYLIKIIIPRSSRYFNDSRTIIPSVVPVGPMKSSISQLLLLGNNYVHWKYTWGLLMFVSLGIRSSHRLSFATRLSFRRLDSGGRSRARPLPCPFRPCFETGSLSRNSSAWFQPAYWSGSSIRFFFVLHSVSAAVSRVISAGAKGPGYDSHRGLAFIRTGTGRPYRVRRLSRAESRTESAGRID